MARDGEFKAAIGGVVARTDAAAGAAAPAADLFGEVLPPAGSDEPSSLDQRRGRPKGALGKRSTNLGRYLAAKGYRDPAASLAELADQDALALWQWLKDKDPDGAPSLFEVMQLQASVRRDLMPYVHAKVPPKIDKGDRLAVMILSGGAEVGDDEAADQALTIEGDWSEIGSQ